MEPYRVILWQAIGGVSHVYISGTFKVCYNRELPSVPATIQTLSVCSPKHQIKIPKRPYIKGDKSDHRNGAFTKKRSNKSLVISRIRVQPLCQADFYFCAFRAKWLHEIIMSYKKRGRLETCIRPSTRILGHVSSLDVRKGSVFLSWSRRTRFLF